MIMVSGEVAYQGHNCVNIENVKSDLKVNNGNNDTSYVGCKKCLCKNDECFGRQEKSSDCFQHHSGKSKKLGLAVSTLIVC